MYQTRLYSIILSLALVLSLLAGTAYAADLELETDSEPAQSTTDVEGEAVSQKDRNDTVIDGNAPLVQGSAVSSGEPSYFDIYTYQDYRDVMNWFREDPANRRYIHLTFHNDLHIEYVRWAITDLTRKEFTLEMTAPNPITLTADNAQFFAFQFDGAICNIISDPNITFKGSFIEISRAKGGTIKNLRMESVPGGIRLEAAKNMEIVDCMFEDVASYGIYSLRSSFTLNNITIIDRESSYDYTSAIAVRDNSTMQVTGPLKVTGHKKPYGGAAIYVDAKSKVTLSDDTSLTGNTADNGGAIFIDPTSTVVLAPGVDISGNTARNRGGGIYVCKGGKLTENGAVVSGNTAAVAGQNIYYDDGIIDISQLNQLILQAEALNAADYTAQSWAALESELAQGKALIASGDYTQAQVDAVTVTLQAAIDSLEPAGAEEFVQRRISEINTMWLQRKPKFQIVNDDDIYTEKPLLTPPYAAGSLKEDYLQDGVNMLNFHRFLAGVSSDIALDANFTDRVQHAAVVMDLNGETSHSPKRPPDMEDAFYSRALVAAMQSNLANLQNRENTVAASVNDYVHDWGESNISVMGHRRWCLNPIMRKTGFGQSGTYHAMYATDNTGQRNIDTIFYPNGPAFPNNFFGPDYAWTVMLPLDTYQNLSTQSVSVTLRKSGSGQSWQFYDGCPDTFYVDTTNLQSIGPCLIFRPDTGISSYEGKYDVVITGLRFLDGSGAPDITYSVTFFALDEPLSVGRATFSASSGGAQMAPPPELSSMSWNTRF